MIFESVALLALLVFHPSPALAGEPTATEWMQVGKLLASDGGEVDLFSGDASTYACCSVALSGEALVVGAPFADVRQDPAGGPPDGEAAGAAYVFERDPATGAWREVGKLTDPDGGRYDNLGTAVAVSGGTAVAGSFLDDDRGQWAGSALVFDRDDGTGEWLLSGKLLASDGEASDELGISVATSGVAVAAGAIGDDDLGPGAGAAYVFERDGATGVWGQAAKLLASDGEFGDKFGYGVAMSGETLAVGAPFHDHPGAGAGAVYVFERDPATGEWSEVVELLASDGAAFDDFGRKLAMDGGTLVVAAAAHDHAGNNAGAVYLFDRDGVTGDWLEVAELLPSDGGGLFGTAVAIAGEWLAVGSAVEAAYLFRRDEAAGAWAEVARLSASDGEPGDEFGESLAVGGPTLVVGAARDDDRGGSSGSAYVFEPVGLGGSVLGLKAVKAWCRNLTTGQEVEIVLPGVDAWDCRRSGLHAAPGDAVRLDVVGRALGGRPATPMGGAAAGLVPERAHCLNVTTGQLVSLALAGATGWSCEAAGLEAERGDRIGVRVIGAAR